MIVKEMIVNKKYDPTLSGYLGGYHKGNVGGHWLKPQYATSLYD